MQAPGSARLLSEDGVVELPFEHAFDYIVVPVSVDGSDPLRLILDTGMPFYGAVLHPNARTDAIELVNRDSVQVMVGGFEDYQPRVGTGVTLTLPGVELTDQLVRVFPDTPTSEGGLQEGDRILSVDGVPVSELGEKAFREALKREGGEITLGVSRNGREMEISLRLRRLV